MPEPALVSIIIPLYVIEPRFFSDLLKFKDLSYPNYEIIVVSDQEVKLPKIRQLKLKLTGKYRTGPAEKRDIAINLARGSICAFIDDDAYPHKNWLKEAIPEIKGDVVAVGGPGVTPPEDSYWERLTGLVYESPFCGGHARYRFLPGKRQFVRDFPAYNLIVKKSALMAVGGYGSHFYGGEDTFLCLKLIKEGFKILYKPQVLVYHHRRALYVPYIKQIANVGLHRGYFARVYPETSFTWTYFLPTFLALGFFGLLFLALAMPNARLIFILSFASFWVIATISSLHKASLIESVLAGLGIILTHLAYGLNFIRGFLTPKLSR